MLDLPVADILTDLGLPNYTVTRTAQATWTNGIAVPGSTSTLSVLGAFWPANGRDMLRLPEARRAQATMKGVVDTALFTGGEGSPYEADQITIDGVAWEIQHVGSWTNSPGFYDVLAQRPNVAP